MFELIKNAFKEAKRLMDKRLEVNAEVKKEIVVACKDICKEVINKKKEAANAVRSDFKEAAKAIIHDHQTRTTIGLACVAVGVFGVGLLVTA